MRSTLIILATLLLQACAGLDKDPTADWSAQDFYEEARRSLELGEFKGAIDYLESLEARFPFNPYAKQAQLDIAYSYYKFDEPESALSAADRFIRLHPRDPNVDYVYYLKGLVHFERGKSLLDKWFPRDRSRHETTSLLRAIDEFSLLIRRYPDSRYAGDAYQRMRFLKNELGEQELHTARFYIERGAWIAAANRAKEILQRYQDTPAALAALDVMHRAYVELGLDDLADDVQRVIDLNRSDRTSGTGTDRDPVLASVAPPVLEVSAPADDVLTR